MTGAKFQRHWVDIDPERMERYEDMFRWNPATEHFYDAAKIGAGQVIADFGCGPGHAAIEFGKRTGAGGHVHALDINEEFIKRTRKRASENGLGDRITAHLLTDHRLPLADNSTDRIIARNTIIYVDDPVATFREFRRVLRPGGIAHLIEGDWRMTAVEPVPTGEWRALIEAASGAWPRPEIGRQLHRFLRKAGFETVALQVLTSPDLEGRLIGMINTVAGYARNSGKMERNRIDAVLEQVEQGLVDGTYLAISPQFVATAIA